MIAFAANGDDLIAVDGLLDALPPVERFAGMDMHAPVILVADIFEPSFCERLIEQY